MGLCSCFFVQFFKLQLCTILFSQLIYFLVDSTYLQVDVHLFDGRVCQGQVFACDFHYNLAAVRIQTDSPLQTPTLKGLDDVMSIDPSEQLQLSQDRSFQLRPHSNLFKIFHGMKIITIWRALRPKNFIIVSSGVLWYDMQLLSPRFLQVMLINIKCFEFNSYAVYFILAFSLCLALMPLIRNWIAMSFAG